MAKVHAYLNFNGNCEEAFNFYKSVFNKEFIGIYRFGDMPQDPNFTLADKDKNKIMHIGMPLNDHTMLMGSDCLESFSQKAIPGTTTYIMIDVDSVAEAENIFNALSTNAQNLEMPLEETFFAERFSSLVDQFGISWMIHFEGNKKMA